MTTETPLPEGARTLLGLQDARISLVCTLDEFKELKQIGPAEVNAVLAAFDNLILANKAAKALLEDKVVCINQIEAKTIALPKKRAARPGRRSYTSG